MILDRSTAEDRHDHWDDSPAAASLHGERSNVTAEERRARYGQKPATVLLTDRNIARACRSGGCGGGRPRGIHGWSEGGGMGNCNV